MKSERSYTQAKLFWLITIIVTLLFGNYGVFLLRQFYRSFHSIQEWGQFGDSFGVVTSILTLLAVWGLILQLRREREQHEEDLSLQKQHHAEEIEAQKKYHEEEMEEQRKLAEGADRAFIMSGDCVILTRRPNEHSPHRFLNNIHESDDWGERLAKAEFVIEVDVNYFHGFILNCAIYVIITSFPGNRTLFETFCPLDSLTFTGKITKTFGLLWTDFDKASIGNEMAVCEVKMFYTNTLGGGFFTARKSEPMTFYEGQESSEIRHSRCYKFVFSKDSFIKARQLRGLELESVYQAYNKSKFDCCFIGTKV